MLITQFGSCRLVTLSHFQAHTLLTHQIPLGSRPMESLPLFKLIKAAPGEGS